MFEKWKNMWAWVRVCVINNLPHSAFSTQDNKELSDSDSDTSSSVADSDNSISPCVDQTEDIVKYVFGLDEESIME